MSKVFDVISGMGLLILVYLFLKNYEGSVKVISALSDAATRQVSTLQGR